MKFLETLRSLPLSRQLALAAATLGVVVAMVFLVQGAMSEPKSLLYSKLEPATAGEVIEELDQRGVEYELRGDSIFIAQSKRDQVRFALARQGLPQQSVQGYELLDDVNGFSVTSEMYNAAYWRAKEGELTRTILAIDGVSSARVHIGANLGSGFTRTQSPQTASVTLNTTHDLSPGQAEAIQYMVALAVAGLAPEDVAVIDPVKGLLAGPNVAKASQPSVVADTQAGMLEEKIMRLIDARVGAGNSRVSVSVDVSRQHQTISERTVDPDSRIVRSRTVNDVSETSAGSSGALSAASNLPQGEGAGGGGNSSTMRNSTESVNYDFNERRTETELLPGEIQRVSVAVLLNEQALDLQAAGQDPATVANEIVADFEQLILSGAGLDTERGDTLTVELMPFQQAAAPEMATAPGMLETLVRNYFWSGMQALLLGLVVLVLGLGVVRPLLTQKPPTSALGGPSAAHDGSTLLANEPTDPFAYLSDYTRERPDETAALLQSWLNEDRKAAVNE